MAAATVRRFSLALFAFSVAIIPVAGALSVVAWRRTGLPGLTLSFLGTGLSLGPCLLAYNFASVARKQSWRRVVMATGGLAILAFALIDAVDLDLEGCWALLFAGTAGVAVGHTMVTTVIGPLVFGRLLCGWGCWRAMVLEHLPVGTGSGKRRSGAWSRMPLVGLALTVGVAAWSTFVLDLRPGGLPGRLRGETVVPVVIAVAVYYGLAIALAYTLHDQRAFCKYLCPSGQILRWTSRRSLLAIRSRPELCTECSACARVCPMDIPVAARAGLGARVGDGECILCQRCVMSCPNGALRMGT